MVRTVQGGFTVACSACGRQGPLPFRRRGYRDDQPRCQTGLLADLSAHQVADQLLAPVGHEIEEQADLRILQLAVRIERCKLYGL